MKMKPAFLVLVLVVLATRPAAAIAQQAGAAQAPVAAADPRIGKRVIVTKAGLR